MIKCVEVKNYKDFGQVLSISNGIIEAYITLDVGPRIIKFGYIGGQDFMHSERSLYQTASGEEFENFFGTGKISELLGGHRIWAAPETYPQTLYPDLDKVNYELIDNGAIFTPPAETENGIQKQLIITMSDDSADMNVGMRIINISDAPKEYAVWGVTMCNSDGHLIIPANTNDTGRLPNRTIAIWSYTDISDDRIVFNKKYYVISPKAKEEALKIGFDLNCGTAYYVLGDDVFIKKYETKHPYAKYPDGNCSFETYTNSLYIELETLSELKFVNPNEALELTENWSLKKITTDLDVKSDDSIDNFIKSIK